MFWNLIVVAVVVVVVVRVCLCLGGGVGHFFERMGGVGILANIVRSKLYASIRKDDTLKKNKGIWSSRNSNYHHSEKQTLSNIHSVLLETISMKVYQRGYCLGTPA